ncbi:MAG: STAS domain-containing protein [Chloroflexi bacterium]|nr:STAS domain-containing protein [Chloroflexota bacterium]MCI0579159.1 STAS domain-containing protein [Chloroflexota bacterium]MCI0647940.1 STAS domain-containing protein [Chloroflexota bacterium]MCI0726450.1 STAS domain-containing protein [Chloroflexota bacterium]
MSHLVKANEKNPLTETRSILNSVLSYFLQPVRSLRTYDRRNLRPDLLAGATGAITLLPQAIAFSLIAELPPEMGLYAAIVGTIIGALWGSSRQMITAPTNTTSLLVLSALLNAVVPGDNQFFVVASLLALMVGALQLIMGLARLGMLVNFVSHSVIIGFASGAGVLIALQQLRPLLGLAFTSRNSLETLYNVFLHLADTHAPTAALGIGTMLIVLILRKTKPGLPAAPTGLILAGLVTFILKLDRAGVQVLGSLPGGFPPLADLSVLADLDLLAPLATGAFALAAIGLVQTAAVSRSLANHTGQRLDSNQEFVGQGLANLAVGFFSGYPAAGSFSASAVNFRAGARSPLAAIFTGLFVLAATSLLAPLAAYLPRAALAGVLVLTAYGMMDWKEIARIWRGGRGDAVIMVVTLSGTLFLKLEFAVLSGILLSFALYILRTSTPRVQAVVPDETFRHFVHRPDKPLCPQLAILNIEGDLYFGAAYHVEQAIQQYIAQHPYQRFFLLRMQNINHCDLSGVEMLENIIQQTRNRGGDVYMVHLRDAVLAVMKSSGFYDYLGADHFLSDDGAIEHLFYKVLDPAICIYESNVRVFKECQNLPRPDYPVSISRPTNARRSPVARLSPQELWRGVYNRESIPLLVLDVREPREFKRGHIPGAQSAPLLALVDRLQELPPDSRFVLVCRAGWRSLQAAHILQEKGYTRLAVLEGGMVAWEAAKLPEAVEYPHA